MTGVVVVGGGAAGLAAAYALRRRGIAVTLFEAQSRVGGRIAGDEVDGFHIDTGAQLLTSTAAEAMRMCEALEVPLESFSTRIGHRARGRFHVLASNPSPREQWANLESVLRMLSPAALWQLFGLARALRRRAGMSRVRDDALAPDLATGESIADLVKTHGGSELLEELIQSNITTLTLAHPEEVGAAFGMMLLQQLRTFMTNPSALLYTPARGIGALAQALARACDDDIRVSTPVERVVIEDGAVRGVATPHGFVAADAVICATTATAALKIIPELPDGIGRALRTVTYSSGCLVAIGLDGAVFPDGWFGISLPRRSGSFMAYCNDGSLKASGAAPPGRRFLSAFLFDAGGQAGGPLALSDGTLGHRVLDELRGYGFPVPRVPRFIRVYRWPEAVCLAAGDMPRAIEGLRRTTHPGCRGLFLAGEYMGLPSVNGALASGREAAAAAATLLHAGSPGPQGG